MSREFRFYLEDILESCRRIIHYTADLSFDQFVENNLVYDAVLRNIEIIGEAVKQVPIEICDQYPTVEWRRIAGMRDIVAHHYFSKEVSIYASQFTGCPDRKFSALVHSQRSI